MNFFEMSVFPVLFGSVFEHLGLVDGCPWALPTINSWSRYHPCPAHTTESIDKADSDEPTNYPVRL
jgi:hypothetical protein